MSNRRRRGSLIKRIKGLLGYAFIRLLSAFIALAPSALRYRVADLLGELAFWLARGYRRVAIKNLHLAFGESMTSQEIAGLARRNFRFLSRCLAEFLLSPRVSPEEVRQRVTYHNGECVEKAFAAGKGVIIYSAHFGNWEWMGFRISLDYPLSGVARTIDDPATDRLIGYLRRHNRIRVIPTDDVRGIIRTLRRGEVVGIAGDQNTALNMVFVDFFGKLAATASGPVVLAKRTGAALVPGFSVCTGPGRYEMQFHEPVELVSDPDPEKETQLNVARCARLLEEQIRRHPEHWLWLHDRWRTRPPGEEQK